jgi:hypothetical protein
MYLTCRRNVKKYWNRIVLYFQFFLKKRWSKYPKRYFTAFTYLYSEIVISNLFEYLLYFYDFDNSTYVIYLGI